MPAISYSDAIDMSSLMPTDARRQPTVAPPDNGPSFLDVAAAAQHQYNVTDFMPSVVDRVSQAMDAETGKDFKSLPAAPAAVKGYSIFNDPKALQGYEPYIKQLASSESPEELALRIQNINIENAHKNLIASDGWRGTAVAFASGAVNPITLATMAIPLAPEIAGMTRGMRVALGTAGVGAAATAQEVAMQSAHETDTFKGGLENVALQTIVGGLLSGLAVQGLTAAEYRGMVDKLSAEAKDGVPGINPALQGDSAGAARVEGTSLFDESISGKAAQAISNTMGHWNPMNVVFNSSDVQARQLAQEMGIVRFMLNKNLVGKATAESIEIRAKRLTNTRDLYVQQLMDEHYAAYGQREGANAVSRREFGGFVQDAMNEGDKSTIPEATKLAQAVRPMFDADKKLMIEMGMTSEDAHLLADESYFPKVYDHAALATDGLRVRDTLRKYFTENPKKPKLEEAPPIEETGPKLAEAQTAAEVAVKGHKDANAVINEQRTALRKATEDTQAARTKSDNVDQTLSELESRRQYLEEDMAGATPEQLAKETAKLDRQIERTREQGHKAELTRAEAEKSALTAEKALTDAKDAVKAARQTAQEARDALKESKLQHAAAERNQEKLTNPPYRDPVEIDQAVEDTLHHMLAGVRGNADLGRVSNPRPTRARTLDVPASVLKPWLVRDFEANMFRYHRTMAPQLEMRKTFGSTDLKNELDNITQNYKNRMANATSDMEIQKLAAEEKKVIGALTDIRDRVLNQVGPKGDNNLQLVRAARMVRSFNYLTLPGSHVLSAMSDYGQLVAKYGLVNTARATAKFFTSIDANKLTRGDMQRMGGALQNLLGEMHGTFADIGTELTNAGRMDRAMNWSTRQFTKVSGMGAWNTTMQTLTSMLEQDALLRMSQRLKVGNLNAFDLGKAAQHGISKEDLAAIGDQLEKYGENDNGLFRARTELWDDQGLARKVEHAIVSNAESVTHNLTAGDLPHFMNGETARMIMQFKSFGMGAVNRIMIPRMQGLAHGDLATISGMQMMLATGAFSAYLKDKQAGREADLRPGHVMAEAMKWSGITAYLPELMDAPMYMLPKLTDRAVPDWLQGFGGARIGSSPVETLEGPAIGTLTTAMKAGRFLLSLSANKAGAPVNPATAAGLHDLRKLIPGNNLFFANRLFNAMEGSTANALDLQGASGKTFNETLTESRPVKE